MTHLAVVSVSDGLHQGQSKTHPFVVFVLALQSEKRLKNLIPLIFWHTRTSVAHLDVHLSPFSEQFQLDLNAFDLSTVANGVVNQVSQ